MLDKESLLIILVLIYPSSRDWYFASGGSMIVADFFPCAFEFESGDLYCHCLPESFCVRVFKHFCVAVWLLRHGVLMEVFTLR